MDYFTILNPGYQKSDSSFAMNNTTRYNRSRYDRSPRVAGMNFIQRRPYDEYNGSVIKVPTLNHYIDGASEWMVSIL